MATKKKGEVPANLKDHCFTSDQDRQRAAEAGRKGGKACQAMKRKKKTTAQLINAMLESGLTQQNRDSLKKLCPELEDDDATVEALMTAGQIRSAVKGNTHAYTAVMQYKEAEEKDDGKEFKIPAEAIGKAFVDINRHIEPNIDYIFDGGRGGLKSSYISLKIIELIKNNPNMHACVIRKVANTLRDSVFAQIKWAINELGLNDEFESKVNPMEIRYKKTGQKIFFRACDDPMKLKSIKPEFGYIGILWVEERDQLSGAEEERSVKQSVLRGGETSYFFASYNPPKSKNNWVNKEKQIPNENRVDHHCTYLDAPHEWLGAKFIADAEHIKKVNPSAYEHEYMGVPNGEGGNVFEFIEIREITDEEIERFDRIYQGVDFGWYPDKYAFIRTHYDEDAEKIYFIDEDYQNKQPNAKSAKKIIEKGYDDFTITCDSAEPKSINDLRDAGLPAKGAIKGAGSVEYGFKWLQIRTLVIDPARTPNALKEITGYEYERDKEGNVISGYPQGQDDHIIAALRYAYEPLHNKRGTSA